MSHIDFLIQARPHCGVMAYAMFGRRPHRCGVCDQLVPDSGEPWEPYRADTTPKPPTLWEGTA